MIPKRFWRDMPSRDFGPKAADWIAVLPVAAIEQHGPHLPVGVDAFIAEALVSSCATALADDLPVVFLPVQEICKSNEHVNFPGTLTLGWRETIESWLQIGQSVARAGLRTLVIVTSHGGNNASMEIVARELRQTLGMRVVTTSWGRLGDWQDIYDYGDGPMIDIHAGLAETSLMLAIRPDLVDMSRAEDFASAQSDLSTRNEKLGWHGAAANKAWLAEDLNALGAVGNAGVASAEAGARDIASMVRGFETLVRELVAETG